MHDLRLNHLLYADDLALLSLSQSGLQRCLDLVSDFSLKKRLTINIDKSKTLTFNKGGKYLRECFTPGGRRLEPVQSFCYLGFDVKASGTVQHALRTLSEKAAKAMRPLNQAISRFNIPVKLAIKLLHSYIEPIILYNAENSLILTNKQFELAPEKIIINENIVVNLLHRKFLKYILGVNRSAPNLAVYGDTGESPLIAKGYRFMINFWYRLHTHPDKTLAKNLSSLT